MAMRPVPSSPGDAWGPLPPHALTLRQSPRHGWRWLERLLFITALLSLGYYSYVQVETYLYQQVENRELNEVLRSRAATPVPASRPYPAAGSTMGRVEIPRLGVSAIVRAGSDARTLSLAVGHVPGTALPGDVGNVGLAGHRDTFFKKLGSIRTGDVITVTTPGGAFRYEVERTVVVEPADVWVLDPTPNATLTLVTCYPFSYIGSAPQRFIVRATLAH